MSKSQTYFSKNLLEEQGIIDWGYTEEDIPISLDHFNKWVEKKGYGELSYLADHRRQLRQSIKTFYPKFQSAVVFLFSYAAEKELLDKFYKSDESNNLKISSYVFGFEGEDYHHVIQKRLLSIKEVLQEKNKDIEVQLSLDIHPVLERDLAYRAGLGWFGKNSMLISRENGSYFLIGSLLLSEKLELNNPILETDHCGQCRACIDACPTQAIEENSRTLHADRCISTYTIELFKGDEEAPRGMSEGRGEVFGCDICQEVCPWNERIFRGRMPSLTWDDENMPLKKKLSHFFLKRPIYTIIEELESWSNKKFIREFGQTPLGRTGRKAILRTLKFYQDKK